MPTRDWRSLLAWLFRFCRSGFSAVLTAISGGDNDNTWSLALEVLRMMTEKEVQPNVTGRQNLEKKLLKTNRKVAPKDVPSPKRKKTIRLPSPNFQGQSVSLEVGSSDGRLRGWVRIQMPGADVHFESLWYQWCGGSWELWKCDNPSCFLVFSEMVLYSFIYFMWTDHRKCPAPVGLPFHNLLFPIASPREVYSYNAVINSCQKGLQWQLALVFLECMDDANHSLLQMWAVKNPLVVWGFTGGLYCHNFLGSMMCHYNILYN